MVFFFKFSLYMARRAFSSQLGSDDTFQAKDERLLPKSKLSSVSNIPHELLYLLKAFFTETADMIDRQYCFNRSD